MSHGTEYQRYKQKLERLQSKVKKSENARKELEVRLQRLMKERNECEKSASIHKSKYDTLLEHERKRLNRNGELLGMLEEVHAKATAMASNTEKLKKLKNQQERVLINNWRRSAYIQQQIFYPNAVQYLPSAPIAYEHQHPVINGIPPVDNYSSIPYDKPSYFVGAAGHSPNLMKSNVNIPVQQPTVMSQIPYSSMMPIYHNEPFNPQSSNIHLRFHENQRFNQQPITPTEKADTSISIKEGMLSNNQPRIEHNALYPNRIVSEITNSSFQSDESNYNKPLTSLLSQSDFSSTIGQPERSKFDRTSDDTQPQFNKSPQYSYTNQPYSSLERDNYIRSPNINQTNRYPSGEESSSRIANTATDYNPQRMSEQMSRFLAQDHHPPTIYDNDMKGVSADPTRNKETKVSDTVGVKEYDRNSTYRNDELFEDNADKDIYSTLPRIESIDVKKSLNTTTTSDTNVVASSSFSPQKGVNFTSNDDNKYFPSSVTTSTIDDSAIKSPYSSTSDPIYTPMYTKDSNNSSNLAQVKSDGIENTFKSTSFRFDEREKPTKPDDNSEKRRCSIDAGSFAKSLGHDSDVEKESIAANIRRRYSVAANFLNLQNSAADSFKFTPSSLNEYRNTSNVDNEANRSTFENGKFDSKINADDNIYSGGENQRSNFDPGSMTSTEINMNRSIVTNYNDPPVSVANTSHFSAEAMNDNSHPADVAPSEHDNTIDSNTAYSAYTTDDQNYVENAMEQLNLRNDDEHENVDEIQSKQFDDSVDKVRTHGAHSKTVTWADDPNSNYKKEDTPLAYDTHDVTNEPPTDAYYSNNPETQQIPHVYTPDGTIQPNTETSDSQYQYSGNQYDNQYENSQYQASDEAANQTIYNNNDYYYANEPLNQYDQYGAQPQQEDPQQMQYYGNDAVGNSNGAMNVPDDGYQQYQTESTLQAPPKQDEYYSVSPGENYYSEHQFDQQSSDYGNVDENQTYSMNTNIGNSSEVSTFSTGPAEQQPNIQAQPEIDYAANTEQVINPHVPNYLQSDTDDSQTGYQTIATNKAPQSQDSDFDFSTNS